MSHCDGQPDGMNEAVKDILRDLFSHPEVQGKLHSSRSKLLTNGIQINLRDK